MFNHAHHNKIRLVLNALNPEILKEVGASFGGGTLIALLNNEYRWSKDIDFICPVGKGYRRLREIVSEASFKPSVLFNNTASLEFPRELTANQYGVRFLVIADQTPIKFEIIAEARIVLNSPVYPDWTNIPTLDFEDQCAEKLLANADRWADSSIESRDLIDLAVLRTQNTIPKTAITKAESAYPVIPELQKALTKFLNNPEHQNKCFAALEISEKDFIFRGISLLAKDFDVNSTQ